MTVAPTVDEDELLLLVEDDMFIVAKVSLDEIFLRSDQICFYQILENF